MASKTIPFDAAAELQPDNEAALRVQLAACYRLVAHFGMDDLIYNHISVRAPDADHHFLINPYGLLFSEITASSFVKIDFDGAKGWLRDSQRDPFRPGGRDLRAAHPFGGGDGNFGAGGRIAPDQSVRDALSGSYGRARL